MYFIIFRECCDGFDGNIWNQNGPLALGRASNKICDRKVTKGMTPEMCGDFRIFDRREFYAVPWQDWEQFMNEDTVDKVSNETEKSTLIHVWNKYSVQRKIEKDGPKTAYGIVAEENCPKVYRASEDYF